MSPEDIDVEAGLSRDHELRMLTTLARYILALLVVFTAAFASCHLLAPPGPPDRACLKHAACSAWKAKAEECGRWTR